MTPVTLKNVRVVRSSWLDEGGRRLDCNPYMSGARESRDALEQLEAPKHKLRDVTIDIFDSGREARSWVDDERYGVRYMGTSAIGLADLSTLPLISKRQVARNPRLQIEAGWSLITRSGTVGRMAYVRPDMVGLTCSEDVLRVVPDPARIPPGYLYAFLSSRFGVPLVVAGTYGAVIQHIEPAHIAGLPVPRFGSALEGSIHELVSGAARKLASYQSLIEEATSELFAATGALNPGPALWKSDPSDLGFSVPSSGAEPLRAWNHSMRAGKITESIARGAFCRLGDVIDEDWLKWRVMFKRIDADRDFGIEVLSQRPLFQLFPEGRWISRKYLLNHSPRYVVPDKTILIAKQGTLGEDELFCQCEFITGDSALSRAYTDHCMRIVAKPDLIEPGYLFAFLRSHAGFRLLRSLAEGTKQQDLHWRTVPQLLIPRLGRAVELGIARKVYLAYANRHQAVEEIRQATLTVESNIVG